MTLDPLLIQVLACPEDKGPLLYFADEQVLFNPRLHRTYAVRDGIPVLLIDEATTVDAASRRLRRIRDGYLACADPAWHDFTHWPICWICSVAVAQKVSISFIC